MSQVFAVTYYTLRELARRKLLLFLVGGGAALILLLSVLVAVVRSSLSSAPAGAVPYNDFSGLVLIEVSMLVSLFAWIASVTIAVTLVNHDLESGSAVSIFSKPVDRLQYALGKMIAAALTMLLIVLILGVGTQVIVLANGGGHEAALLKTFVLIAANQLTQMLIILALTVVMNNIVAAGIGIVVVQVTKLIGGAYVLLNAFVAQSAPGTGNLRGIASFVDVVYWLVPRYLDSDLQREVYQSALSGSNSNLSAINVSGPVDVLYWALWAVLLFGLLYLALHRREV
jgi:ABC-type transport system involved in multi-copper enzyme maturation permease subunit